MIYNKNIVIHLCIIYTLVVAIILILVLKTGGVLLYICPLLALIALETFAFAKSSLLLKQHLSEIVESMSRGDFSMNFNFRYSHYSQTFASVQNIVKNVKAISEIQLIQVKKVLESVDTGVLLCDSRGNVLIFNRAAQDLFNLPWLPQLAQLQKRNEGLNHIIDAHLPGEQLFRLEGISQMKILSNFVRFVSGNETGMLYTFKNVGELIADTEVQSWQKVLRTLTHEIMNSLAPITSLAQGMEETLLLERRTFSKNNLPWIADLSDAVTVIRSRSEALLNFAVRYRSYIQLPKLDKTVFALNDLFTSLKTLLKSVFSQIGIAFEVDEIDSSVTVFADRVLIEQVLVNLLTNAKEAVIERKLERMQGAVHLSAAAQGGRTIIKVTDNGAGIPPELIEDIFTPFFTTKKTGSGIGLSLSRQIMHLHQGKLSASSVTGTGTTLTMDFGKNRYNDSNGS